MDDMNDNRVAVTKLLSMLGGANPAFRREAATQLGLMLPRSKKVIRALGMALNDKDNEVAQRAGIALFSYGVGCKLVITAVINALEHSDVCVRRVAAGILFLLGPDPESKSALPVLEQLVNDPDASLRGWARQALNSIKGSCDLHDHRTILRGSPQRDFPDPDVTI